MQRFWKSPLHQNCNTKLCLQRDHDLDCLLQFRATGCVNLWVTQLGKRGVVEPVAVQVRENGECHPSGVTHGVKVGESVRDGGKVIFLHGKRRHQGV